VNSTPGLDWVSVTPSPLSPDELSTWVWRPTCGAIVTFSGNVRSSSTTGHDIVSLEYETSEELAERRITDIIGVMRSRWPELGAIAVHHRVGKVELGGVAVVVAVSSPHRQEAFDAAKFCIDAVKTAVPMWKREVWEGGSIWSEEASDIVSVQEL
jgi:molybdopterin synthase catalytic subunit